MTLWVDTDYGFDDMWALLVLQRHAAPITGISLVAGNAVLPRVIANALSAREVYGISAPLFAGASKPLKREQETAERILGAKGMCSRNRYLPEIAPEQQSLPPALPAMIEWLNSANEGDTRDVIALGPLTNLALLHQQAPQAFAKITRLVWMGGSQGRGNHTAYAEFNAFADPEAAYEVAESGLPFDVLDLEICWKATFSETDMPDTDPLTADLLGGYLDIAKRRGRDRMAIYDPVAAVAYLYPEKFHFQHAKMNVSLPRNDRYGATQFDFSIKGSAGLAVQMEPDIAALCLSCLKKG